MKLGRDEVISPSSITSDSLISALKHQFGIVNTVVSFWETSEVVKREVTRVPLKLEARMDVVDGKRGDRSDVEARR